MSAPIRCRDDVQTDYHGNRGCPVLNVKCHLWERGNAGSFPDALLASVADECGEDPGAFVAWWRAKADEETPHSDALSDLIDGPDGYGWRYAAAESAWETAGKLVRECFPTSGTVDRETGRWSGLSVHSEGRQGGWLVVTGLPPVDSWDAVALARWRKFARWIGLELADFPRQVAWLICANVYEPERADAERAERDRLARIQSGLASLSGLGLAS